MGDEVLRPPKILIAEDNPHDRMLLQYAFRSERLPNEIVMVEDGAEAIATLQELGKGTTERKCPVDLLILDIQMPNKGGLDVLEWMQNHPGCSGATVVVMSGLRDPAIIDRALALGAQCYFFKPGDYGELISFIQRFNQLPAFNYILENQVADA
jgi:CheY-like chemotaxis protein